MQQSMLQVLLHKCRVKSTHKLATQYFAYLSSTIPRDFLASPPSTTTTCFHAHQSSNITYTLVNDYYNSNPMEQQTSACMQT